MKKLTYKTFSALIRCDENVFGVKTFYRWSESENDWVLLENRKESLEDINCNGYKCSIRIIDPKNGCKL